LLTPPPNLSVTLEMDMLGLLPLVKPNTTLRGVNQTLNWSEAQLISVAATLVQNGMLKVGTAPLASVDPAFVQALRQAFTRCVGPAASIVWTNTAKRLGINGNPARITAWITARITARVSLHRILTRPGRIDQ
jgi:hypothetical protein